MNYVIYGALSALAGAVIYANLPTSLTLGATMPTATYLRGAAIRRIVNDKVVQETITAGDLFKSSPALVMAVRRPGCALCRNEAKELSGLKQILDDAGISLYAVVHEANGVSGFRPYFKGEVFFDVEKRFYGPNERWIPLWMGFLRPKLYYQYFSAKKHGVDGNTQGEGRLLGGVFLISGDELPFAHLEKEWGDSADIQQVRAAVEKLKKVL